MHSEAAHPINLQTTGAPARPGSLTGGASSNVTGPWAVGIAFLVSLGAAGLWAACLVGMVGMSVWLTPRPPMQIHARLAALPPGPPLDGEAVAIGEEIYRESCIACHGTTGLGLAKLGKDLVHSDFIAELDDAALVDFINRGRDPADPANTTGVGMPAKGGNPTLTKQDMQDVVAYLRLLQDPRRDVMETPAAAEASAAPGKIEGMALTAGAGGLDAASEAADLEAAIARGRELYAATCASCHGEDALGTPESGNSLRGNRFVLDTEDGALLEYLKTGRAANDPRNRMGVEMPARGGDPGLSEDDLYDIIDFLRSLAEGASAKN